MSFYIYKSFMLLQLYFLCRSLVGVCRALTDLLVLQLCSLTTHPDEASSHKNQKGKDLDDATSSSTKQAVQMQSHDVNLPYQIRSG